MSAEYAAIAVALFSLLGTFYGVFANRGKTAADAATSNVDAAIRLRDEALEDRRLAEEERRASEQARNEAELARDAASEQLQLTLKKLDYLEGQGVTELRKELNEYKERVLSLEDSVHKLKQELKASKMREGLLRKQLRRIRQDLDTGPLSDLDEVGEG